MVELVCLVCGYAFEVLNPNREMVDRPICPDPACKRFAEESSRDVARAKEFSDALFGRFL